MNGEIDPIVSWFSKAIPGEWFAAPAELRFDRDEVVVIGQLHEGVEIDSFRGAASLGFRPVRPS